MSDNTGKVGDVLEDCAKCGFLALGPWKKDDEPFVCKRCIANWRDLAVNVNTSDPGIGFSGDVYSTCFKCGKGGYGKQGSEEHGPFVCNICANRTNPAPKPLSPHYTKLAIDPYEYAHRNRLGMLQGNVVKYVTRYKDKNGKEDLEKAMNTLKRLIEMEYPT